MKEGDEKKDYDGSEKIICLIIEQIVDDSVEPAILVLDVGHLKARVPKDKVVNAS